MSVQLIGLAFDAQQTHRVWGQHSVRESFDLVLKDDFRRKVDFRSMRYHTGHLDLLSQLDELLRVSGGNWSILELIAARFKAGVEDSPIPSGNLVFDYQWIRYFASLAMVDDFLVADPFLKALLKKIGFTREPHWSILEFKDLPGVCKALREARMQDILDVSSKFLDQSPMSFTHLVRNYIEFLSYTQNNRFVAFFYNSQTSVRQWGELIDRNNQRNEKAVELSLQPSIYPRFEQSPKTVKSKTKRSLEEKHKMKRESLSLMGGLSDSDLLIRQKAAESLSKLANEDLLPFIQEQLPQQEAEVRLELVRTLGCINTERAQEMLLEVLTHDETQSIRLAAAFALREMGNPTVMDVLLTWVEQERPYFASILAYHPLMPTNRKVHQRLQMLGESTSAGVTREVAFLLGKVLSSASDVQLVSLCKNTDDLTVRNALYSLWSKKSPKLSEGLKAARSNPSAHVQLAVTLIEEWKTTVLM